MRKQEIKAEEETPPKISQNPKQRGCLYYILLPLAFILAYGALVKIVFNDDVKETRTNSSYEQAEVGNILGNLEKAALYYNIFGLKGIENLSSDEIFQRIRDYNP